MANTFSDYCKVVKIMKDAKGNLYTIDEVVALYNESTKDSDDYIGISDWCKDNGITGVGK